MTNKQISENFNRILHNNINFEKVQINAIIRAWPCFFFTLDLGLNMTFNYIYSDSSLDYRPNSNRGIIKQKRY